jgi:hypothetical protein
MMYSKIVASTAVLLAATTALAAPASEKVSRSTLQFAVNQVANPKFQGASGVLAMAKTYAKFKKPFTAGLKNALDKQFPGWGRPRLSTQSKVT